MADPFIGEIRIFAGTFEPRDWRFCNGQLLNISQHPALFSILGSIYGGDGRNTFALPDLRDRLPMHTGEGPGLTERRLGEKGGVDRVTLTPNQLGNHSHALRASGPANTNTPGGAGPAVNPAVQQYHTATNLVEASADALPSVGGGGAHTNEQPYLALHFIIAVEGVFPGP